ncbi:MULTISPECIES: hypothetical protein [Cobetia]|uniref:hypothetical protein n=1 Tax=Cobetia TaxID=204286 RepID=UPI0009856605|nr:MULTISPECIES: hypothetical protein [Cobetia]POR07213.1 hypothetical protein BOH68_06350 [Cobetia sp. MM1IDA2H-1]
MASIEGKYAQMAEMLLAAEGFLMFLDHAKRHRYKLDENTIPDGTHQYEDGVDFLCKACGVTSLAEMDKSKRSGQMLPRIIANFRRWQSAQRRPE